MKLFSFKEIFRVVFKHDYYRNIHTDDLAVEPTRQCRKLLKNYGLKFKSDAHGFAVYADSEKNGSTVTLIRDLPDGFKLSFVIGLNNPYFMNFTDLPIKLEPRTIYYFNNLTDHQSGGDLLLINKDEIPKLSNNQSRMVMSSEHYSFSHTSSEANLTGTVTFIDHGGSVSKTIPNDNDIFNFHFDLSQFDPGRCRFSVEGVTDSFYAANEIYRQSPFGIVEIFAGSAVPADYRFVESGTVKPKEFVVYFTNRSTIWRYFLYDKLTNTLTDPRIDMTGVNFDRQHTPATNYPEDFSLFRFTSIDSGDNELALPLTEAPVKDIKLSGQINGSNRDIINNLSNPAVSSITPDETDTGKIYSDIIVYV